MAIATLAFNLKAWMRLVLPKREGAGQPLKMTFRRFIHSVVLLPAQVKKGGRRLVVRLLGYSRWVALLLAGSKRLRQLNLA